MYVSHLAFGKTLTRGVGLARGALRPIAYICISKYQVPGITNGGQREKKKSNMGYISESAPGSLKGRRCAGQRSGIGGCSIGYVGT